MSEAHAHSPNRKQYWQIFVALAVLTVLEVGLAKADIGKNAMVSGLVGLALTKAALVLFFYMHLLHETRALKRTVILPFFFPALYAVVLMSEGWWRGLWGQLR